MDASDIASDMTNVADATEAITIKLKSQLLTPTRSVANALRRQLSKRERSLLGIQMSDQAVVFNIQDNQLTTGDTIEHGDEITASGSVYKVMDVTLQTLQSRWRCVCKPHLTVT